MARKKNALTEYHIAKMPEGDTEPDYKRLAKWVQTATDDSEEETEEIGFYDGDGTPSTEVMSVRKVYTFEGFYDEADEAHNIIKDLEFEIGEGRIIMFKQVRTDGTELIGPATVTEPKITGGEATEYALLSCGIGWNKKPDITLPNDPPENGGEPEDPEDPEGSE